MRNLISVIGVLACASTVDSAPVQWPTSSGGNGHYYDVINASITWANAKMAAESSTHLGNSGNLVTITSADENLFLTNTFGSGNLDVHWLGLFQAPGGTEPAGGWTWVTGEPFTFNGWFPGEPNNTGGNEDRALFAHPVQPFGKGWNDAADGPAFGYVVEYPVPEPTSSILLATLISARSSQRKRKHPKPTPAS